MASTARKDKDKKEYFDSPEELERKVHQLSDWVRATKHFFVFTVSEYQSPSTIGYTPTAHFLPSRELGSVPLLAVSDTHTHAPHQMLGVESLLQFQTSGVAWTQFWRQDQEPGS